MINIEPIVFNKNMYIDERILYAYLMTKRELEERSVEYGYISKESVTEDGMYYTVHSNKELMELLCCCKSKLIKVKKSLEDRGLLIQKRTLDGSNKYFVRWEGEINGEGR